MTDPQPRLSLSQELIELIVQLKRLRRQVDVENTGMELDDILLHLPDLVAQAQQLEANQGLMESFGDWLTRLVQSSDSDQTRSLVLDLLMSLVEGERGLLMLKDAQGEMVAHAMHNIDLSDAQDIDFRMIRDIAARTAEIGQPVMTTNTQEDSRFSDSAGLLFSGFTLRSIASVPLKNGAEVIGVVYLDRRISQGVINRGGLQSAADLAAQVGPLLVTPPAIVPPPAPAPQAPEPIEERRASESGDTRKLVPPPAPAPDPEPDLFDSTLELERLKVDEEDDSEDDTVRFDQPPAPTRQVPRPPVYEPPPSRSTGLLGRIEAWRRSRQSSSEEESPVRPRAAAPAADYNDMKARLSALLLEDIAPDASTEEINEALTVLLAEEGIVLTREERHRLLELVLSDLRGGSDVRFSAYYPAEARPGEWDILYAYVLREAVAGAVQQDAAQQLGDRVTDYREVARPASRPVDEGAMITATPYLPGFQFNPPSLQMGFFEDWHRFDFKLRAKDAPLDQAANGILTFSVEGVIVADVPMSIFVSEHTRPRQMISAVQKAYNAVFCSYSHDDSPIVERVERAIKTLGVEYLRDVHALRSGQHWGEELYRLIDRADIFQLFWSPTAATSHYVEQEWRYALSLKREDTFIRPVYWQRPIPQVPPELGHIHFAFQADLGLDR